MFKLASPVLSLILAGAIFFFFAKPLFAEIEVIQDETTEYREAVEKATEFNNFLQSLITKRNSFSSRELERLETMIPQEVDEVRALVDLKALAEEHGLLFGNIQVSQGVDASRNRNEEDQSDNFSPQDLEATDISFGVIGTYEEMRSFLGDVERSLVFMEVMNLSFGSTEGDLNLYTFKVRLYAFNSNPGD